MNSRGVLSVCQRNIDDRKRMQWMNGKWGEKGRHPNNQLNHMDGTLSGNAKHITDKPPHIVGV